MNVRTRTLYCNLCIPQITLTLDSSGLESTKTKGSVASRIQQWLKSWAVVAGSGQLYKAIGDFFFMKSCASWWMCWKLFSCGVAWYVAVKLSRPGLELAVAFESDLKLCSHCVYKTSLCYPKIEQFIGRPQWMNLICNSDCLPGECPPTKTPHSAAAAALNRYFGRSTAGVSCFLP